MIKEMKTWQKILLLICVAGFLCSLSLFFPKIQVLILDLGEQLIGRALNRPMWYRWLARTGIFSATAFVLMGFLLFPVQSRKNQIFLNAKNLTSNFAKKPLFAFPVLYITLLAIGFSLMCLAYSLPVKTMQDNLVDSVPYFKISEQFGNQRLMETKDGHLDDFTDALMLIEAAHKSEHIVPVAAMLNERPSIKDKTPYGTLVSIYGDGDDKDFSVVSYSRYWHGYEIFLKPVLCLTTYGGIRFMMTLLQITLVILFIVILARKNRIAQIIPFFGMWIFLNPPTIMISMQYNSMFVITMIELILIASFDKSYYDVYSNKLFYLYHFFITGCLASYFDFLTYPLLTFGVPVIFLITLNGKSFKDNFVLLVKCAILWSAGYILMWAGKWILGSIVTGTNIFKQAKNAIEFRTSSSVGVGNESFSYFQVALSNLRSGVFVPMTLASLAIFIYNTKRGLSIQKKDLIFLVSALMPFAWYFAAKNHSFIHSWMTYRILGITVFSILTLCVSMRKKKQFNEIS